MGEEMKAENILRKVRQGCVLNIGGVLEGWQLRYQGFDIYRLGNEDVHAIMKLSHSQARDLVNAHPTTL